MRIFLVQQEEKSKKSQEELISHVLKRFCLFCRYFEDVD
jgi:hypothetical protein